MSQIRTKPFVLCVALAAGCALSSVSALAEERADAVDAGASVAPVIFQPAMNVFRRFAVEEAEMFEFYGDVLGFEQLETFGAVHRFQTGASEFKLTRRVGNRTYEEGGVADATGLRLVTFYFGDEEALVSRFEQLGYPVPEFQTLPGSDRRVALTWDPDGQAVELVVVPGASEEVLDQIGIGLTVSDMDESRAFYRDFVGLDDLGPVEDRLFGATSAHRFRHGPTLFTLRSFADELPADTGSGGIQYVVSDVERVDALAKAREVTIDTPLTAPPDAGLRVIWLSDPDGITNYFAETTWSRASTAVVTE